MLLKITEIKTRVQQVPSSDKKLKFVHVVESLKFKSDKPIFIPRLSYTEEPKKLNIKLKQELKLSNEEINNLIEYNKCKSITFEQLNPDTEIELNESEMATLNLYCKRSSVSFVSHCLGRFKDHTLEFESYKDNDDKLHLLTYVRTTKCDKLQCDAQECPSDESKQLLVSIKRAGETEEEVNLKDVCGDECATFTLFNPSKHL